jgi:hypothetical protein
VLTGVKIEHDHCAWERSLNPTSTVMWLMLGSFFLLTNSLPAAGNRSHGPLPSSEGCGAVLPCSVEGSRREEHQGSKWDAQAVRCEIRHEPRSRFRFSYLLHTTADRFGTHPQHPHANPPPPSHWRNRHAPPLACMVLIKLLAYCRSKSQFMADSKLHCPDCDNLIQMSMWGLAE